MDGPYPVGLDIGLYEQLPESIGIYTRDGRFVYLNPAAGQLLRRPSKELLGRRFWEEFPSVVGTPFHQAFHRVARTGQSEQFDTHYTFADWDRWFTHRLYASGELIYGVSVDITGRKRDEARRLQLAREVEAARAETEAERRRLQQLFTEAPAGIALLQGPEHVYILSNPLNSELIGNRPVLGKPVREVLPKAEEQGFITILDRVYTTGETYVAQEGLTLLPQPDGSLRTLYLTLIVQPTHDATGAIDGTAVFIFDVTDQVLAHKNLEVLAEQLRHGEERLRTLVEASSSILWSVDAHGRIVEDSPSWRAYTGQTREQWLSPGGWLEAVHPEDRPRTAEVWNRAVTQKTDYEVEFRLYRHQDRTWRYVLSRAVLLRHPDGSPREWFGAITDIHHRKQGELQLQQSIRMRDEFLSVASHELRTPLTPLNLLLHGLQRAASSQPDTPFTRLVHHNAETGRRQIQRLVRLVEDLLDVSRIVEGRLQPRLEEVDLVSIAREAVGRIEPQAAAAGCALEVHAPGPVVGQWDRLRLEQVLVNLVENALKYGPGKPVRVRVEAHEDRAVLSVRDEGIGIPPEHQARVFERFERAVSDRHYGGLGLGLYISCQIVRAHGGNIRVDSTPGVETTFTVELPLAPRAG
ncbi:sensor histidine kinase [Archangium lipolyticum]|uniref:sensor histidine kinase n=1 Tax=Archangium lipolyticum TaxID=2970465 RepID=UPI00214A58AC|nr:PAS domain-containing protein [Archangium lipolyticum]